MKPHRFRCERRLRAELVNVFVVTICLILVSFAALAHASVCSDSANYRRNRPVKGTHFMIAAAHPLATEAGCEVLQNGGTAIDAAIATQMVLAVVEPQSSGLAGGTLITYYDDATQQVRFFEGLSKAPQHVTADIKTPTETDIAACGVTRFRGRVNNTGRAFGVPGTVRVLEMVHNIYGNKPWDTLFEAGINIAETGFPMPRYMNTVLGEPATARIPRCKFPDLQARYCIDEHTPKPVGTPLFNHDLAQILRIVRDGGATAFYDPQGSIVQSMIARVTAGPCSPVSEPAVIPSLMTAADFSTYQAQERQPVCATRLGLTVCSSAPPAFGGTALLYELDLMSQGGIETMKPNTLEWVHLFIESSRLAQIDRRQYIGDPDFNPIPVAALLDPAYLQSRYALFSPTEAPDHADFVGFGHLAGDHAHQETRFVNPVVKHREIFAVRLAGIAHQIGDIGIVVSHFTGFPANPERLAND